MVSVQVNKAEMSQMWSGLERSREAVTRVEARLTVIDMAIIVIITMITISITTNVVDMVITIGVTTILTITFMLTLSRLEELWQRVDALRPTIDTKLERLMEVGALPSSPFMCSEIFIRHHLLS